MKKLVKKVSVLALLAGLVAPATAFAEDKPFDGETVKVGVASDDEIEVWEFVAELAEKEGITLEVELFNDYVQPNVAVASGDLDLNAFQHVAYLEEWNKENDEDLQPIGYTYVSPLGAYSEKVTSLDELAEGAVVAIPNDPTNGGRALLLLEQAGVLEVDDAAGVLPTVKDITKNDKKLEFKELDAAQVAVSLPDVDAAIINTNYALDHDLSIEDDAIFVDTEDLAKVNEVYKNVVVTRKDDVENELYKHIVELYQSEEVAEKITEITDGANVAAW
ncbi:MetQ/NlpA family ABC transporter substrate-binding protein [Globicatella sanguinis]|uniref:MetQ/NlpA family ABC transporter substrate-binding protein n=1 Tax=Globicatella sanguinis TaxID=13076 RepID=UPI002542CC9D|nr:MetQ/NlpA family ABC transporter substrate-binding protein [Globicatella sanguinis]MDK7630939.1 MetQ/NlpA family ABC transporter substrate-binding protein [Globicatella sanguinis]WIK65603.1 MetQ/NlpA family ABC transporter substrate-binding protein [Globicatella sanguinis]WKT55008.1 MetQ/NlpA family ABC transporter substrate-binding protein [Globicatella sanguinis]